MIPCRNLEAGWEGGEGKKRKRGGGRMGWEGRKGEREIEVVGVGENGRRGDRNDVVGAPECDSLGSDPTFTN